MISNGISAFAQSVTLSGENWSFTAGNTAGANGSQLTRLLSVAQTLVTRLVPFMVGLAVLAFFWYLVVFIWKGAEEPAKRQEGIKGMGYSMLALFVMVSIWGIITFIGTTVGIGQGGELNDFKLPGFK